MQPQRSVLAAALLAIPVALTGCLSASVSHPVPFEARVGEQIRFELLAFGYGHGEYRWSKSDEAYWLTIDEPARENGAFVPVSGTVPPEVLDTKPNLVFYVADWKGNKASIDITDRITYLPPQ